MVNISIVQTHLKIMNILNRIFLKDTCVSISKLANLTGADPRTIKKHLLLAEINEHGYFADEDKKIYCKKDR